ncbi:MAG: hypothetical protein ABEI96_02830 [Haloarculaceae archaeon]
MSDRRAELQRVVEEIVAERGVVDAWLAKSFTDRLVVVDVEEGRDLPASVRERLRAHDCYGANDVYDVSDGDDAFAGATGDATRYQFVDVQTRGEHQSYVLD